MVDWPDITVKVKGTRQLQESLNRIEGLLRKLVKQQTEGIAEVADTLDDVRSNLQELNVDVDTAITGITDLRSQVDNALANAGVDQAARDEINSTIDGMQQRIVNALNPAVPVDPGTVVPIDPNDLPHPDQTLPGDLPSQ
jgi:ABC-type transporter Mla subunit MlaD